MAEHRHDKRIECDDTCILLLGDLHHVAKIKNISFGGALVHFHSSSPSLQIGEICNISIVGKNGAFPFKYSCEVVRSEAPDIALTFISMHKLKVFEHDSYKN